MLCELCKKNPATIHIQEIVHNKKRSLHICSQCAAEKVEKDPILQGFNLADMLYNFSDELALPFQTEKEKENAESGDESRPTLVCSDCGWDSAKFRKTGRLGCAQCYMIFREMLTQGLNTMHKGTLHVGKKPGAPNDNETSRISLQIMKLQHEMDEYVQREEYERAAELRDQITTLKEELMK